MAPVRAINRVFKRAELFIAGNAVFRMKSELLATFHETALERERERKARKRLPVLFN